MALPDYKIAPLITPQQPRLPAATSEYDANYQNQLSNVLRLYFNQIQTFTQLLASNTGSAYLRSPYGAFSSSQTQTATANTATLLTLNTTDFSNGVSISSSKITVANPGIYNLQFSVQVENTDNASHDMYIWLKQDGTDIAGSTGVLGLPPRKSAGDPFHDIKGWNYFVSLTTGQYIEIYWSVTNAAITIPAYAASGTPTKPSTASVVATMSFVSALAPAIYP